jgi:hypothetical protein
MIFPENRCLLLGIMLKADQVMARGRVRLVRVRQSVPIIGGRAGVVRSPKTRISGFDSCRRCHFWTLTMGAIDAPSWLPRSRCNKIRAARLPSTLALRFKVGC